MEEETEGEEGGGIEEQKVEQNGEEAQEAETGGEEDKKVEEIPEEPEPKELTAEEAGKCLGLLGKIDDSLDYAFLKLSAVDMKLTSITGITTFPYVRFVDVSGNYLQSEDLYCLSRIKYLLLLRADRNRIESPQLPPMDFLQVLTLNKNRISSTEGIKQPLLECLEICYNKLETLEGLKPSLLPNLKTLEFRGNKISSTAGISFPSLQALYLAENKIEQLVGLEMLEDLQILHLRANKLKALDGFSEHLKNLKYLNLRNNDIVDMKEISKLKVLPRLEILVVSENPFLSHQEYDYRMPIIKELPRLRRLNKEPVTDEDVDEALGRKQPPLEDTTEDEGED